MPWAPAVARVHAWLGDAVMWLAGLHALAGLFHHYVLKDDVLESMLPRRRARANNPSRATWAPPAGRRLDCDRRLDGRVWVVALEGEILVLVVEDRRRSAFDDERRIWPWFACRLGGDLFVVIAVDVAIAARPDEVADIQVALLGQHVREQCVAGDVEGHPRKMSALRWSGWRLSMG